MARTELDRAVQPSLLDRLTDEEPRVPSDPPISREESARRYRQSVQRDLDWLMNTRASAIRPPRDSAVFDSVQQYGLVDFTGLTTSVTDWREQLVENMRDMIRRFEPRLANVTVDLAEDVNPALQQVRFTISALLLMDPSPEQVVFDTIFEVTNGTYEVEDKT
jgi:type VI secretion system protein ImpF